MAVESVMQLYLMHSRETCLHSANHKTPIIMSDQHLSGIRLPPLRLYKCSPAEYESSFLSAAIFQHSEHQLIINHQHGVCEIQLIHLM